MPTQTTEPKKRIPHPSEAEEETGYSLLEKLIILTIIIAVLSFATLSLLSLLIGIGTIAVSFKIYYIPLFFVVLSVISLACCLLPLWCSAKKPTPRGSQPSNEASKGNRQDGPFDSKDLRLESQGHHASLSNSGEPSVLYNPLRQTATIFNNRYHTQQNIVDKADALNLQRPSP